MGWLAWIREEIVYAEGERMGVMYMMGPPWVLGCAVGEWCSTEMMLRLGSVAWLWLGYCGSG